MSSNIDNYIPFAVFNFMLKFRSITLCHRFVSLIIPLLNFTYH